ncbi:MAG: hypothetical protein AAF682_29205 [Planctomycetota bacterium]
MWKAIVVGLAAAGTAPAAFGQQCVFRSTAADEYFAGDSAPQDLFGIAIDVDGDACIVGANGKDFIGGGPVLNAAGAAYVFRGAGSPVTWTEQQKLLPTTSVADALFGVSVAIQGDVAVVGATRDNTGVPVSGAAYVFRFDSVTGTWSEEQKLQASDAGPLDRFGTAVAIDGDVIVVGAYQWDGAATDQGAAYVFRYNSTSWVEEDILSASAPGQDDLFGIDVAVSGDVIAVSSSWDDPAGSLSGSAWMFRYDAPNMDWVEEQMLVGSNTGAGDQFGTSLALDGDLVVIGSPFADTGGVTDSGGAYAFRYDPALTTWAEEAELAPDIPLLGSAFGSSIALEQPLIGIGAGLDTYAGQSDAGAGYVFRDVQFGANAPRWTQVFRTETHDPEDQQHFAHFDAVGISGANFVAGALRDDSAGPNAGSFYAYEVPPVALAVNDNVWEQGDFIEITTCGGVHDGSTGAPVSLFADPPLTHITSGLFDFDEGWWRISGTLVDPVNPASIFLQSYTIDVSGTLILSNRVSVTLQ